jgi:hypothetical protein
MKHGKQRKAKKGLSRIVARTVLELRCNGCCKKVKLASSQNILMDKGSSLIT